MSESRFDKELAELDALKGRLATLQPLNKAEIRRLREDFMIENTYNTNAIEGNKLTLRETALVLMEGMTIAGKPLKDHLEAVGHREAFEYMVGIADTGELLTERIIKEIHTLVLMNDTQHKGTYRGVPVIVRGALHTPPQPYLVAPQMETLFTDYDNMKRDKHIIEAIAEFHLRFEGIHPFIDGNGRTGRLIINLELIKAGFLPVDIKFTDRDKYYICFDDYCGEKQTPDTLTKLIIDYEKHELERYIKIVEYANGEKKECV